MIIYKNNKNEHIIDNFNYDTGLPEELSIDEKVNNIVLTETDLNKFKNKELTNLNLFLIFNNKLNVLFVDKYNYSIDDKIYDLTVNNKFKHLLNYNIQYIKADVKNNLVYNNKFKINLDLTNVNEDVYEIIFFNKNTSFIFDNLTVNDVNNQLYYSFNLLSSGIIFKLYKVSNKWFIDTNSNIIIDNIHEKISNYLKNSFYI